MLEKKKLNNEYNNRDVLSDITSHLNKCNEIKKEDDTETSVKINIKLFSNTEDVEELNEFFTILTHIEINEEYPYHLLRDYAKYIFNSKDDSKLDLVMILNYFLGCKFSTVLCKLPT